MIIGIGIDIIEINRIVNVHKTYKKQFVKRILNKYEKINKKNTIEKLSKNFAVKESLVKALGTGFQNGLAFNRICIRKNSLGKPFIKNNNNNKILISLSHEKKITISITLILTLTKLN